MNWLDITLIVFWILFLAAGARMGSVWTAACLVAGALGAALIDIYALPVAGLLGDFPGAPYAAAALLYLGGLVVLIPGYFISRMTSLLLLGIVDGLFGLLIGVVAGLAAVVVFMLGVVPHAPSLERSKAWQNSTLMKPLHAAVEDLFSNERLRNKPFLTQLKAETRRTLTPVTAQAKEKLTDLAEPLTDRLKK